MNRMNERERRQVSFANRMLLAVNLLLMLMLCLFLAKRRTADIAPLAPPLAPVVVEVPRDRAEQETVRWVTKPEEYEIIERWYESRIVNRKTWIEVLREEELTEFEVIALAAKEHQRRIDEREVVQVVERKQLTRKDVAIAPKVEEKEEKIVEVRKVPVVVPKAPQPAPAVEKQSTVQTVKRYYWVINPMTGRWTQSETPQNLQERTEILTQHQMAGAAQQSTADLKYDTVTRRWIWVRTSTPSYSYSTTPSYEYSSTPTYRYTTTPTYRYSSTPSYSYYYEYYVD